MLSHFLRKLGGLNPWRTADRTAVADGWRWHVAPGASVPALAAWRAAGLARVVKQNLQRTIERVALPGGAVFVKQCRVNTPRSWLREIVRPPKARLEFENAVALARLGVDVVTPIAWGTARGFGPTTSALVTKEQPHAVPLPDVLEQSFAGPAGRALRRQLTRGLAQFLARMHDAGVAHPDPHPGNLLVELPPTRVPKFVLIDVHAVHFGPPLTAAETLANLTLFNRFFQLRATRADRLRFWRVYAMHRTTCDVSPRELEAATLRSNHRFWANRVGRYAANNREFRRIPGGYATTTGPFNRDTTSARLDEMLADPAARLLKNSRSSTVAIVQIDGRPIVLKRFRHKNPVAALKNLVRPTAAFRSWILGHNLRDRGLPTPRPLVALHRYRLGIPCEGYVAFEFVDGCGLAEAVGNCADFRELRAWTARIGRLVRAMHDRRVSHRDLKAANVIMSAGEPVLVDLVGVTIDRDVPFRTRARELARLNASFLASDKVTRTDRLRVLRAYMRWALHGRGDWKAWWRAVAAATAAKADRNARRGRVLA